jgi:hypothetical protein
MQYSSNSSTRKPNTSCLTTALATLRLTQPRDITCFCCLHVCCRYALVNPVAGTSHLKVADEGIALLNSIDGPVSPIVVIGPYRSGKSFLLNQLLGVPCSELTQLQK